MFMISAIRELFNTVISITQLDLALVIVIVKELASIVIIRLLLNEKQFVVKPNNLKLISSKVMPIAWIYNYFFVNSQNQFPFSLYIAFTDIIFSNWLIYSVNISWVNM